MLAVLGRIYKTFTFAIRFTILVDEENELELLFFY